jgi:hypothetical protein
VAKCIAPHVNNSTKADLDRVAQVFVAPFSKEQTTEYIENFAASKELNMDHWSAAQFQAALVASPDVAGLASSPLMLFMVLTILPSISGDDGKADQVSGKRAGSVRMDPRFLVMSPLVELKAEGAWLFPKLRLVEVYLAFFRVWLRRELQRGKYADLKLSANEWDEKVAAEEEQYLDFCRRLAFAMFKRGVTSWTVQREQESAAAGQAKVSLRQQLKAKQAPPKAHCFQTA